MPREGVRDLLRTRMPSCPPLVEWAGARGGIRSPWVLLSSSVQLTDGVPLPG